VSQFLVEDVRTSDIGTGADTDAIDLRG
jgi:hypothetical protein